MRTVRLTTTAFGGPHVATPTGMSARLHLHLARLNRMRLTPVRPKADWREDLEEEMAIRGMEIDWVESERARIGPDALRAPRDAARFLAWFEQLQHDGPGQHDPLFTWLAERATLHQMRWFLRQEIGGEAGYEDLVALTQVRMPSQAKLELARSFWDGMTGPTLAPITAALELGKLHDDLVWEARALGNLTCALAANRRYAFHSLGALGVVALLAPAREGCVLAGLERLHLAPKARAYFERTSNHAWSRKILGPLVASDPDLAPLIAEGALLRLEAGARCFARYREELDHVHSNAA